MGASSFNLLLSCWQRYIESVVCCIVHCHLHAGHSILKVKVCEFLLFVFLSV